MNEASAGRGIVWCASCKGQLQRLPDAYVEGRGFSKSLFILAVDASDSSLDLTSQNRVESSTYR